MNSGRALSLFLLLAACDRDTRTQPPTEQGVHFSFSAEKRGTCFGGVDSTPISPELEQWRRTGGTANGTLVAWARDILRGSGCDEHRFGVIQSKFIFDLSDLPPGLVGKATFTARIREIPTERTDAGSGVLRPGGGFRDARSGSDCLTPEGQYFAFVSAAPVTTGSLTTGPFLPVGQAVEIPVPETGTFGDIEGREFVADLTGPIGRMLNQRRGTIAGVLVSPPGRLDPEPVRGGFGTGVVHEPWLDNRYCAAYVTDARLTIETVTRGSGS